MIDGAIDAGGGSLRPNSAWILPSIMGGGAWVRGYGATGTPGSSVPAGRQMDLDSR
jgi:hypothetical protein